MYGPVSVESYPSPQSLCWAPNNVCDLLAQHQRLPFPFLFSLARLTKQRFLGITSWAGHKEKREGKRENRPRTQFLVFDNWPVLCQKMSQKKGNVETFHFSFVSLLTLNKSLSPAACHVVGNVVHGVAFLFLFFLLSRTTHMCATNVVAKG